MESILATTRDFEVCGTCCELRGPFTWTLQGHADVHVQDCQCVPRRGTTWPGFDFNTVAELCQVCGCSALPSGSRFSVWLCGVCKELTRALNRVVGQAVVPPGRHSIMNGFALPTTPMPADVEIDAFVGRLGNLREWIDRLGDWSHAIVRANLAAIGREDAERVALPDYLCAVAGFDRRAAFDALVVSISGQPT